MNKSKFCALRALIISISILACVAVLGQTKVFATTMVVDTGTANLSGSYSYLEVNGGDVYALPGSSFGNIVVNGGALYLNGAVVCSEDEYASALSVFGGHVVATNTDFTVKQYDAMYGDTSDNYSPVIDIAVQELATEPNVIFSGCRITGKTQSYVDWGGENQYDANMALQISNGYVLATDTDLNSFNERAVYICSSDSSYPCKFVMGGNSRINNAAGSAVGVHIDAGGEFVLEGNATINFEGGVYAFGAAQMGLNDEIYGVMVDDATSSFVMKDESKIVLNASVTLSGSASEVYGVHNCGSSILAGGRIDVSTIRQIVGYGVWNEGSLVVGAAGDSSSSGMAGGASGAPGSVSAGPAINVNSMFGASLVSLDNAALTLNAGSFKGEMQILDTTGEQYSSAKDFADYLADGKVLIDLVSLEVLCTKGAVDAGAAYGGYSKAAAGNTTVVVRDYVELAPAPGPGATPTPTPGPGPELTPTPTPSPEPGPTPGPSPQPDGSGDDWDEPETILNTLNWTSRGEMVLALYKAEGCPKMGLCAEIPFVDVPVSSSYYEAIRWAYSIQLVQGTSPTTFEPDKAVCREDASTFIWNYCGRPGKADAGEAYYTNAMKWLNHYPDALKEIKETKLKQCFEEANK